jgi:Leucine-rich repeat (LRR) protein
MMMKCTDLKCLDISWESHRQTNSTVITLLSIGRNNEFKTLPGDLANLTKLKELVLSKNLLQSIPDKVLGAMAKLETLKMDQNALKWFPPLSM